MEPKSLAQVNQIPVGLHSSNKLVIGGGNSNEISNNFKTHRHSPSKLSVNCSDYDATFLSKLLFILSTLPDGDTIQHLTINLGASDHISDVHLELLAKVLKNLRNLKEFVLVGNLPSHEVTTKGYKKFTRALGELKFLARFELSWWPADKADLVLSYIEAALSKLRKLSDLKLDLISAKNPERSLANFAKSLYSFGNLQKLDIILPVSTECSQLLADLAKSIEHHTCLIEFKLLLNRTNRSAAQNENSLQGGINKLINSLTRLVNLKKLNLGFVKTGLSSENLRNLAMALEQLPPLLCLGLNLQDTYPYADEDWASITNSIATHPLARFEFTGANNFSKPSLSQTVALISQLKSLTNLSLKFYNDSLLNNEIWRELAQIIGDLTELKRLSLSLVCWNNLSTDQAISDFLRATQNLQFESLDLDFNYSNLTKDGLQKLTSLILNSSKKLKECLIHLAYCSKLNGIEILKLITQFGNLDALTKLQLKLGSCSIPNEILKEFGTSLSRLNELRQFNLSLTDCRQSPDAGKKALAESLGKLAKLAKFSLALDYYGTVNAHSKKVLAAAIKKLKEPYKPKSEIWGVILEPWLD
jgi:hypothetical protein